ncbi:MAG: hypothetical protein LBS06_05725 [Treponema sp.]|jgi:hypothetical protein|nr:hypothetical protein [Treponema sp.]
METSQTFTIDPDDPPTFEKAWALIMKVDKQLEENARQMKETDRRMEETARQMKETDRRMEEANRQFNKRFGEFTNRLGEVVEYMVVPNLVEKFRNLGFTFTRAHRNTRIADRENNIFTEVDVFLENGDCVMIAEVKTTLTVKDVDEHRERMGKLRKHADLHNDHRKYLGAVAGAITSDSVKNYALKQGFFVIVPSGDTFDILRPKGNCRVREW